MTPRAEKRATAHTRGASISYFLRDQMAKTLLSQGRCVGSKPGQGTRSHMLQLRPGDVCMLLCPTLCDPIDCTPTRLLCPWDSSGKLHWSGLLYPPPGNLPNPGIKPQALLSAALIGDFFTTSATWEDPEQTIIIIYLRKKMPPSSNDVPRKEETSKSCSEHKHTAGEPKEGEAASPGGTALRCLLTPQ